MDAITIADVDLTLSDWIRSLAGADVEVRLTAPADGDETLSVNIYLIDVVTSIANNHNPAQGLSYSLGYLVTTAGPDPEKAHRLFDTIIRAAVEHEGFHTEFRSPQPDFWVALGAAPRPCFWLRIPLTIERAERRTSRRVERPAEISYLPATSLAGVVLGPGQIPIPRARVEVPALDQSTYTDSKGRFRFAAVPAVPHTKQLRVSAKGYRVTEDREHDPAKPVVIHLALKEN